MTDTSSRSLAWIYLLVLVVALVVRVLVSQSTHSLVPDGVIELEQAQALAVGRWNDALALRFHPLYASLVALGWWITGADFLAVAITLSVGISALVAPASAACAALLLPQRARSAAFSAGLLAAVQPAVARLDAQIMAYGTSHALLAGAMLLTLRAANRPGWGRGALAGLLVGLGFLARSDALATGAGLGLALLLARAQSPGRRAAATAGFAAGALCAMFPYLIAMRVHAGEWRLSLKKEVGQLLDSGASSSAAPPSRRPQLQELIRLEEAGPDRLPAKLSPQGSFPLLWSAGYAWGKLTSRANPLLLFLGGVGLLLLWPRAPPGLWSVIPLAWLTFWVVLTLLKSSYGSLFGPHASAAGVLVCAPAGCGLVLLRELDPLKRPTLRWWLPRVLLSSLLVGLLLLKTLAPQHLARAGERQLGTLLRARSGPGSLTVAGRDTRVVAYFAQAAYLDVPPGEPGVSLRAARAAGARYLVIHLRSKAARPGQLERALTREGLTPIEHSLNNTQLKGSRTYAYEWLVYELD